MTRMLPSALATTPHASRPQNLAASQQEPQMGERTINDIDVTMKTSLHLPQAQALVREGYREIGRGIAAWLARLDVTHHLTSMRQLRTGWGARHPS